MGQNRDQIPGNVPDQVVWLTKATKATSVSVILSGEKTSFHHQVASGSPTAIYHDFLAAKKH
jgi:hypothetical protein